MEFVPLYGVLKVLQGFYAYQISGCKGFIKDVTPIVPGLRVLRAYRQTCRVICF